MFKKAKSVGLHELIPNVHYFIPISLHERSGGEVRRFRARRHPKMSRELLTYQDLKDQMRHRLGEPDMPKPKAYPNLVSALQTMMKERAYSDTSLVGSELRFGFYKMRDEHLARLENRLPAPTKDYIANRKSLLKTWHLFVLLLDREAAARDGGASPLQIALRSLFAHGVPVKPTAIKTGVPLASLKRWLAGARPRVGCERLLTRLERFFRMSPGTLVTLAPRERQSSPGELAPPISAYRQRLRAQRADPYRMRPWEASAGFQQDWRGWLDHKTDGSGSVGGLLRKTPRGNQNWRLRDIRDRVPSPNDWVSIVRGKHCPSALMCFGFISAFIGYLMREESKGGLGMAAEQAQTLGQICNIENVNSFLAWTVERSGGIEHSYLSSMLTRAAMLCNPNHGFLVSCPAIGRKIGVVDRKKWVARCKTAYKAYCSAKKQLPKNPKKSRDPNEPISSILALDNPLDAVVDAVRRIDADRPTLGGKAEAIWARKRLLLTLLASNPLRARNLRELTYRKDNTGQLRQEPDGAWKIVIDKPHFKNERGAARDRDYDVTVQAALWPHISRYINEYRPWLTSSACDLLFTSSTSSNSAWDGLNRAFEALTRRYFQNCDGTGPQSMRHIVATAIVKCGGGDGFAVAALVLHDREATVRAHYGHLRAEDGSRAIDRMLGDSFRGM
jgi:integrase